jgi:hypothetical protein
MIKSSLNSKKGDKLNDTKTKFNSFSSGKKPSTASSSNDIDKLQENLMKALDNVFDGQADLMDDDTLLNYDTDIKDSRPVQGPSKIRALLDKSKSHLTQSKVQLNLDPTKPIPRDMTAVKQHAFLTGTDLEGKLREKPQTPPDDDEEEEEPEVGKIGDLFEQKPMDDLEELRRMIKRTNKKLNSYGKEVATLKSSVSELNLDAKELGYGVDEKIFYTMESQLGELKTKSKSKGTLGMVKPVKTGVQLAKITTPSKPDEENIRPSSGPKPVIRSSTRPLSNGGKVTVSSSIKKA